MKKLMFIVVLILATSVMAWSQLDLVWDKTFPDSINIEKAKFSADGKYIFVASNNSLKKMNTLSGEFESTFIDDKPSEFYFLGISASKNYLISANPGCFKVWDIKKEKRIKQFGGGIVCFFISIDDKYMYWLYADGKIKVVDFQTDTVIKQIQTHSIQSAVISNNGKMLAIGSTYKKPNQNGGSDDYCKIEIWDTEKLEIIKILQDTKGSSEGYKDFDFCYGDTILASTPYIAYRTFYFNVVENKLIGISEDGKGVGNMNYTPNNSILYQFELTNFDYYQNDGLKYKYPGYTYILESGGKSSDFYVLAAKMYRATLYKNSTTGITEPKTDKFNVSYSNNILTIKNITDLIPIKKIIITDIQGKTIYQMDIEDLNKTNISVNILLNSGVYFAQIFYDKVYTQKFQVLR